MVENVIQIKKWNNDKCCYKCKNPKKDRVSKKDYIWNIALQSRENDKHLASIIDDSVITCDEIIDAEANSYDEETKIVTTNYNEKSNL